VTIVTIAHPYYLAVVGIWQPLYVLYHKAANINVNKTAELSQRRPRDAPNIWVPWKRLRVLTTHPATFPEICNGLLFWSILKTCVQKLKFVALSVPEIIGGTQKTWAVPVTDNRGYFKNLGSPWIRPRSLFAHGPFSPKFLIGFCSHGPSENICQIWSS